MAFVNLPSLNNLQATTTSGAGGLQNILNVNVVAGGGGGSTNTTVTTLYTVLTAFADGTNTVAVGDTLQNIQVIDATGTVTSSVWQDLTQGFTLVGIPPANDIAVSSSNPLTDAQLRATPVPMSTTQLPTTLGTKTTANSVSVASAQLPTALGLQATTNSMSVVVANPSSLDNFPVANQYTAIAAGTGFAIGDVLQQIQAFNFATNPAVLISTVWENLTQQTILSSAPSSASLTLLSGTGLTNAQLRATPVPVSSTQLPATLGTKTIANSTAVSIASDQIVPVSSTQLPTTLGAKAIAASTAVNIASDQVVPVSATALPLPTGAATSVLQTSGNASLTTIASQTTNISSQLPTSLGQKLSAGSVSTVLASDSVLPLPTGAATSALQTAGNATLTTITGQLPATLGAKAIAASLAVNIASDQIVPVSSTQLPTTLGAKVSASSTSVVLASDQAAVPVTATQLPTALGAQAIAGSLSITPATSATFATTSTQLPATLGQAVMAASTSVAIASDQSNLPVVLQAGTNLIGSATAVQATAANLNATVVGTSGAPLATAAQLPATIGSKTSAASMSVVIASDQTAIPVTLSGGNPSTIFSLQQTMTTSAVAMASNALSNGVVITAASTNTGIVYVGPTGVTTGNGYALIAGQSISYGVTNTSAIFLRSTVAGDIAYATGN